MTSDDEILAWLAAEYAKPFVGWDFSYLRGRRHTIGDKAWDLETIVLEQLAAATTVLDVDTGDGRRFAGFLTGSGFEGRAAATEAYAPNVPLARATLASLGVDVRDSPAGHLPFADGSFDLVLNRHGSLDAAETRRVLRPGGWLATEQVRSQANPDIHRLLGAPLPSGPTWDLATARAEVEAAGLRVHRAEEDFPVTRYDDVGALAWYLKAIPWQVPDFSVERSTDRLLALHRRMDQTLAPLDVCFHLFLLLAQSGAAQYCYEMSE